MEEEYKVYRVNTKIPRELNEWLDKESKRTGVSKSTLIMLAVQAFHDQKEVVKRMAGLGDLVHEFEKLREAIERNELE